MRKIRVLSLEAKKILNSAGVYSLEVRAKTERGEFTASLPEGTSKGKNEVKRYKTTIDSAIKTINTKLSKQIKKVNSLSDILKLEKKTIREGGAVCLAITFALLKALAADKKTHVWKLFKPKKKQIPLLLSKMLGGGKHTSMNSPTYQEFLVLGNAKTNLGVYNKINNRFHPDSVDLEHGWVIDITNHNALKVLREYADGTKIGIDVAASSFYNTKTGFYDYKNGEQLSRDAQMDRMINRQREFDLYYIEDPLQEEDFEGFAKLTKKLSKTCLIAGDDLFATNPERLKKAINVGACNSCIVKPDQIGSLAKVIEFVRLAKKKRYIPVISHRSGETDEDILADIAVGLEIPIMKISIAGKERLAKIKRLMKIQKER
ncbi:MAG: enolase C-terminal domain-like protein [Candidatus Nanoarchaeia archaeon]|nr:enolase C-terminal domain-like protein [Candidatus Nanoarchaeia archaeon]